MTETPPGREAAPLVGLLRRASTGIADRWADLPLFQNVFTVSREEAVEAGEAVLRALADVAESGRADDVDAPGFDPVRRQLSAMRTSRAGSGLTVGQIDGEVNELRTEALRSLREEAESAGYGEAELLRAQAYWSELLSTLRVLFVRASLQEDREIVERQSRQLMEMSTPVIKLWDRLVAVPLIGVLDSARSQVVMENLLQAIVEHNATMAILDITGVPTVDSLVAQHLMKTVASARLMGADCVVSGIRPAIAQTIVQLGLDLGPVTTRATLAEALELALELRGERGGGDA